MKESKTDFLAELIQGLTKSEKRYFKLFAKRHMTGGANKYVALFDAIGKSVPYDEAAVMKKFTGDPMLNNFTVTKKRLYDQVLKSLRMFHTETTITTKLNELLIMIEVLYKKGLYKQALKKVRYSQKIAKEHDQSSYLLLLLDWESKLFNPSDVKDRKEKIQKVARQEEQLIGSIQNKHTILQSKEILIELQKENKTSETFQDRVNREIDNLTTIDNQNLSLRLETEKTSALALGNYLLGNKDEAIDLLQKKINLYLNNEDRIREAPTEFMSGLANLIHLECSHNDFTGAHQHLSLLKSFPDRFKINKTKNFNIRFFATQQSLELSYWMLRAEFDKIISQEEKILNCLDTWKDKFPEDRKAYFHYMMALALFYVGAFKKSLFHSNIIVHRIDEKSHLEIITYNKWLQMFLHIEMGNNDFLSYQIPSFKRFLKKHNLMNEADQEVLMALNKIKKDEQSIKVKEVLEKHLEKIQNIDVQPHMQFSNSYFDYTQWVKSKINGDIMADQIKRA